MSLTDITEMPGANFWAVILFFTLVVLGFSSAFAMLDAIVTLVMDTGTKLPRPLVVTILTVISFLCSLPYCTEFGFYLLDGIDRWINDVALIFVVWSEVVFATTVYRYKDVIAQVGRNSFILYNSGYFGGMVLGPTVAHAVSPAAGAGVGLGIYAVGAILSVILAKTPDSVAPRFWGKNAFAAKFWYVAFYSVSFHILLSMSMSNSSLVLQGNQLRRDLNLIVGLGKNWKIPSFWSVLLRYVSGPILAIIYSFSYPAFNTLKYDPLHIAGFTLAHFSLIIIALGFIVPRFFNVFIPPMRRDEGKHETIANVPHGTLDAEKDRRIENGEVRESDDESPVDGVKEGKEYGGTRTKTDSQPSPTR